MTLLSVFSDITYQPNYFSMSEPGVGRFLVALSVQGVVYIILLFVIELQCIRTLRRLLTSLGRRRKQVHGCMVTISVKTFARKHSFHAWEAVWEEYCNIFKLKLLKKQLLKLLHFQVSKVQQSLFHLIHYNAKTYIVNTLQFSLKSCHTLLSYILMCVVVAPNRGCSTPSRGQRCG